MDKGQFVVAVASAMEQLPVFNITIGLMEKGKGKMDKGQFAVAVALAHGTVASFQYNNRINGKRKR